MLTAARPATQSRSSPPGMGRLKAWHLLLVCIPVMGLAVYYTPQLMSIAWHATHGMSIHYRGLRVRVPLGWTAVPTAAGDDYADNPQGITIEKQPGTSSVDSSGSEVMYFNVLLPDPKATPSEQVAQWQSLFRWAHPASAFDVAPAAGTPSGMDCLLATPRGNPSAAALACALPTEGWLAQFAGSKSHVPIFLKVASSLKSKS